MVYVKKDDFEIGRELANIRLKRSLSQDQLADMMNERGHQWSRKTVWSMEKGIRSIRLSEAYDLEDILGISLFGKTESEDATYKEFVEDKWKNEVKDAVERIRLAYNEAYELGLTLHLVGFRMDDGENKELPACLSGLGEGLSQLYFGAPAFLREKNTGEEFIQRMREHGTPFTREDVEAMEREINKPWHKPLGNGNLESDGSDTGKDDSEN